ncbi:MAG TPA: hypothetical protein VLX64_01875 [Thermoplasmata archaeon]|nr:hypothetical protein [Thermoplasmata archaeon]
MTPPFPLLFLALLVAYLIYSVATRLDPRYPIGGALVLLVVAAVADAAGDVAVANSVAEYVFFLLGGGVLLLLIDHLRTSRAAPSGDPSGVRTPSLGPAGEPAHERDGAPEQPLDRPQQ